MIKTHPKAFYMLNFVSMWEYFSYYGMRILLVLYLVQELHFTDQAAFILYAAYTTAAELGGLVGGMLADRFLGLKRMAQIGGWLILAGHTTLALAPSLSVFCLGLLLIIMGTGGLRTNIAALVGKCYEDGDPKRDSAYTLYYSGINIGGLCATILCGFVAQQYGWHAGFGLAAIGMLAGNIVLLFVPRLGSNVLPNKGRSIAFRTHLTKFISEKRIWMPIVGCLLLLMLFYGAEEQLGSTLILFSERHVNRTMFFGDIPSGVLTSMNPIAIILAGPLISWLLSKHPLTETKKLALGFALLGIAFFGLGYACLAQGQSISLSTVVMCVMLIALGELFIGPTVYAIVSRTAPEALQGFAMGLLTIGFGMANLLSGGMSILMAITDEASSLDVYLTGFTWIGSITIAMSVMLLCMNLIAKKTNLLMRDSND